MSYKISRLEQELQKRILVLDGAMGTMIQRHKLTEEQFRGERFADWPSDLKGNNDLLVLTQPEIIREIHNQYFEAGADIVETNTFNSTTIAMADYKMESLSAEINEVAARIARECADEWTRKTPNNRVMLREYWGRPIEQRLFLRMLTIPHFETLVLINWLKHTANQRDH